MKALSKQKAEGKEIENKDTKKKKKINYTNVADRFPLNLGLLLTQASISHTIQAAIAKKTISIAVVLSIAFLQSDEPVIGSFKFKGTFYPQITPSRG